RIVGLHPHEHGMLAILLCLAHGFTHTLWSSDLRAADLKDDVATFEAMLGGDSVGIDLCHHHAFRPASGNLPSPAHPPARLGQARTFGVGVRIDGAGLS